MSAEPVAADDTKAKVTPPHKTLAVFALFLTVCGFGGFIAGGATAKAATSIYFGVGSAAAVAILAYFSQPTQTDRARAIAVHIALVLCLVFMVVFAWRSKLAFAVPEKRYLSVLLGVMCAGAFFALAHLIVAKPKKKKPAAGEAEAGRKTE